MAASKFPVIRGALQKAVEFTVPWRDAASLILVGRRKPKPRREQRLSTSFDYYAARQSLDDHVTDDEFLGSDARFTARYEHTDDALKRILAEVQQPGEVPIPVPPGSIPKSDFNQNNIENGSRPAPLGRDPKRDFSVLMVKRTSASRFMPGSFVFPGGAFVDTVDNNPFWIWWYAKYSAMAIVKNRPVSVAGYESVITRVANLTPEKLAAMERNEALDELLEHVRLLQNLSGPRPPSFEKFCAVELKHVVGAGLAMDPHMPAEIAFRICAIRELFEETGIFLARNLGAKYINPMDFNSDNAVFVRSIFDRYRLWIYCIGDTTRGMPTDIDFISTIPLIQLGYENLSGVICPDCGTDVVLDCQSDEFDPTLGAMESSSTSDVRLHQAGVNSNPQYFFDWLSRSDFVAFPHIRSIMEWSNWLAPTIYPNRSRFDTMFYIGFVDYLVPYHLSEEVSDAKWMDPEEALSDAVAGRLILPPPQFYELSRLANFASFDELKKFAEGREPRGIERYCPRMCLSSDGKGLSVLPGDDLYYMSDSDIVQESTSPTVLQNTALELRNKARNLHRFEYEPGGIAFAWHHCKLYSNTEPSCGHLRPVHAT